MSKKKWIATVDFTFDIEADTEREARAILAEKFKTTWDSPLEYPEVSYFFEEDKDGGQDETPTEQS